MENKCNVKNSNAETVSNYSELKSVRRDGKDWERKGWEERSPERKLSKGDVGCVDKVRK